MLRVRHQGKVKQDINAESVRKRTHARLAELETKLAAIEAWAVTIYWDPSLGQEATRGYEAAQKRVREFLK